MHKRGAPIPAKVVHTNPNGSETKKRKTTLEVIKSNPPAPRDVMHIHNSDGMKLGIMQQVPFDPAFPITEELLIAFSISDETIRKRLLFFLIYMFDFAGESAVRDGLCQLVGGMQRSVGAHRESSNRIFEISDNFRNLEQHAAGLIEVNKSLTRQIYDLQQSASSVSPEINRLETEVADMRTALQKEAEHKEALNLEISTIMGRHREEMIDIANENKSVAVERQRLAAEVKSLQAENQALSSKVSQMKENIHEEISKIQSQFSTFMETTTSEIAELSSQITSKHAETSRLVAEVVCHRNRVLK